MLNLLFYALAGIGACCVGTFFWHPAESTLTTNPPPAIQPSWRNPSPFLGIRHTFRRNIDLMTESFIELYHPRTPIGRIIEEMHDPLIRDAAGGYLEQAWSQIKTSTRTISPEAASRLENDLEPMARQTLGEIAERLVGN